MKVTANEAHSSHITAASAASSVASARMSAVQFVARRKVFGIYGYIQIVYMHGEMCILIDINYTIIEKL